ncbi:hypothetical protein TNCV_1534901 [Trichonephila clavipes]|uniref:Uncharacterized protein n=1 Tax=Trichonephila clavipes TaxID=2585209 RepID=A0A8X6R7I5_TRICX|nr:hypothetical protein TNCV_1534901 [Trichonephila clavipes]
MRIRLQTLNLDSLENITQVHCCGVHIAFSLLQVNRRRHCVAVLDESRSFFRVHTGYFSNIPKCIKAEFITSWACSQSSVVSSSQR